MLALKRRLYRLILRLHPAAFRDRFAREMALDFEDALATYGFLRLFLDALRCLVRQWTPAPILLSQMPAATGPASLHPLLAGQYVEIRDKALTLVELLRGTLLFAVFFLAVGFAFNAGGRRLIPAIGQELSAGHDGGLGVDPGHPSPPTTAAGAARRETEPDYSQTLEIPVPLPPPAGWRGRVRHTGTLYVNPNARARRIRVESWTEFLTRCVLVSAIVWLFSLLLRRTRSIAVRVLLAALGLLGVALSAAASPAQVSPLRMHAMAQPSVAASQNQADGVVVPKLEVVSVKQNLSSSGMSTMGVTADGLSVVNTPLLLLIQTAFDGHFSNGSIHGLPTWEMNRYDIAGKVSDADVNKLGNLTQQQKIETTRAMLRVVLTDRFRMIWHDDDKEGPVYDLVIAKSGAKLVKASPGKTAHNPVMNQRGRFQGTFTTGELAHDLSGPVTGRVVVDRTGLGGQYDLTLTWTPDQAAAAPGPPAAVAPEPAAASAPSIFTAVEEQLGLKLDPSRGPVKSLVIDHIEKPSEN